MSSEVGVSIRSRALRGTLWVLVGNGASQGLRLASNLILSRLLFPEAFGLMAIVNLVTLGLQMISNVGIRPAIIRHAEGDRRDFLDTAWTIHTHKGDCHLLDRQTLAATFPTLGDIEPEPPRAVALTLTCRDLDAAIACWDSQGIDYHRHSETQADIASGVLGTLLRFEQR